MMTTSSVSKGCFVFKPSPKKKKLSLTAADYFIESLKSSEDCRIRFESYQLLWQQMKSQTEQLQEELNKKLFDNLICYLKKSHSDFQDKRNDWNCRVRSSEIPTAALLLGVNVTDHELTFSSLSDTLHEHVTPYVVLLPAKECPGIKQLLQKLFSQLMGCEADLDLDEEDDHASISQRSMKCSMASLSGWYQNITKKSSSPSKRKRPASSERTQAPPIVVVFKDLESFTSSVLQEFIVISSRYCKELPLVLIFGIATSPMIIHRLLSHSVSSLLCIELFQSLSCTEHLATVVDKLLLSSQFTFKLSGRVLQVLITIFLYHDFSVQNFIKGLQLSAVEHFNSQPLSVLCCDLPDLKHRVKSLSHNQCENIRHLASFRSFVESQTPQAQVKLLTDDGYLKEMSRKLMEDLHTYHENYIPVLRCLHHFTCILPKFPLGKQIRELYCTCLEKNIWDTEEYNSALALLRMLAKDELVATLYRCFEVLKPYSGRQLDSALKKTKEFLAHFECLEVDGLENVDNEESATQKDLQKNTNLYQLQKTLLEMKETRRTKKPSKFEFLRLEVVDFLDGLVRAYLIRPEEQPLYEVVYFSAASILRRHLNAVPRVALHTALNNPSTYLKSLANDRTLSSAAPDICIAYKLHLECGRLINLYDWLEAFATVVHADDSDSESLKQVDEMTHARFIRAVSELELLGFVKPTKLKTDHVARLTWGGC